mmetsp:Transcript_12332/g.25997  ORF Transcript_12332/g.25997 Transcript_12332/m.25997 type:complete len:432 (-) Transcript_12332:251-1546(-)
MGSRYCTRNPSTQQFAVPSTIFFHQNIHYTRTSSPITSIIMICENPFEREPSYSSGSDDTIVDQTVVDANYPSFNRYQMKPPFKKDLPSKLEFGAEFKSIVQAEQQQKIDFDEDEEEQKMVKFLTQHSKTQEWNSMKSPESTTRRKREPRAERPNRRDRLEREIAKLILKEAPHFDTPDSTEDGEHGVCELSPSDILLDLVDSSIGTLSPSKFLSDINQGKDFDTSDSAYLGHAASNDKFEHLSLGKSHSRASDSDIFNFNKEEDEWAEFDDTSMMNVPLLPSHELDKNGFPVSFGSESEEEVTSRVDFESSTEEVLSPELVLQSDETKESAKQQPKPSFSCDDAIVRPKSNTNLLCLTRSSSSGGSYKFEVPQSPSSVTDFDSEEKRSPGCKTMGSSLKRCHSGASSISAPKIAWNPKPPKHYNHIDNVF